MTELQRSRPRRLVEGAALAAALATPLFFATYTEHVFEPAKAALVRFLGTVAIGAGLLLISRRSRPRPGVAPIALAIAMLWLAELVATVVSRVPWISLMGAPDRGQGLLTLTAMVALAFGGYAVARRPQGGWRLIAWMSAAALPVSLYAVAQYGRWSVDPLPWAGDTMTRVAGSAGNSVMLAAHLALVTPLAMALVVVAWRSAASAGPVPLAAWLLTVLGALSAIVVSGSRGPALALAGGLIVAGLMLAVRHRSRRAVLAIVSSAAVGVTLIVAVSATGDLPANLARLPVIDRLSQALDPTHSTTRVRLRLWDGSAAAIAAAGPRLLVGYGPESMSAVWAPFYPSILAYDEPRGYVPDRAHNLALDDLLTVGLLGLLAHLVLFTAVIEIGLKRLALLHGGRWSRAWIWRAAWFGGGVAGAAVAWALGGPSVAGLGLGLGLVCGLAAWLVIAAFTAPSAASSASASAVPASDAILVAALMASAVTHLLELQVSFATVATRLTFLLVAAAVAGVASAAPGPSTADAKALRERHRMAAAVAGLSQRTGTGNVRGRPARRPWVAGLRLPDAATAAIVIAVTMAHAFARPGLVAGGVPAAILLTLASVAAVALAVGSAARVASKDAATDHSAAALGLRGGDRSESRWTVPYLAGLAILAALASGSGLLAEVVHKEARLVWIPLAQEARAEAEAGRAEAFFAEAAARFGLASRLAPWSPEPRLSLGRLETERGDNANEQLARLLASTAESGEPAEPDEQERPPASSEAVAPVGLDNEYTPGLPADAAALVAARDAAFQRSLVALSGADRLWAPAPEPALTRARAIRVWAERTRSPSERAARLSSAADAYEVVMRRAPHWPEVFDEAAWVALLADAPAHALTLTSHALAVDPFFLRANRTAAAAHAALGDDVAAAAAYDAYFADDRNAGDLPALRARLAVLLRLGQPDAALPVGEGVALLAPNNAHAHADLAVLREAVGDLSGAVSAAERAAELAPSDNGIASLVRELRRQAPSLP